ncbi:unnamed protein product [Cyprideis torosa]|uniref:Uncharacterized protein n=1 Tax=Cyprideis torosa TaxID=163714 RepID=A0A7R8WK18_9CRUS|nr:unnamed protein product [Cyprideis torosa]CAG0896617.1 unnamed protein product [Cyprideis torosa]
MPKIDLKEIRSVDFAKPLGLGSFADVFPGLWHSQEIAIKRFRIIPDASDLSVMKLETTFGVGFLHPNIVPIYGTTKMNDGTIGIVMERADRGTLRGSMKELADHQKVTVASGTVDGLVYLHSKKIVHRDLKPENILLFGNKPTAKISDFGTSKIVHSMATNTMMIGTPKYSAPELLEPGLRYGTSADVYSLSLILFELFGGEDPFKDCTSVMQVLTSVLQNRRPTIPQDFPEGLRFLLQQGWSRDPLQRPALSAFQEVLQRLFNDLEKDHTSHPVRDEASKLEEDETAAKEVELGAAVAILTVDIVNEFEEHGQDLAIDSPICSPEVAAKPPKKQSSNEGIPCEFCGLQFSDVNELCFHEEQQSCLEEQKRRAHQLQEQLNREDQNRSKQVEAEIRRLQKEEAERRRMKKEAAERRQQSSIATKRTGKETTSTWRDAQPPVGLGSFYTNTYSYGKETEFDTDRRNIEQYPSRQFHGEGHERYYRKETEDDGDKEDGILKQGFNAAEMKQRKEPTTKTFDIAEIWCNRAPTPHSYLHEKVVEFDPDLRKTQGPHLFQGESHEVSYRKEVEEKDREQETTDYVKLRSADNPMKTAVGSKLGAESRELKTTNQDVLAQRADNAEIPCDICYQLIPVNKYGIHQVSLKD